MKNLVLSSLLVLVCAWPAVAQEFSQEDFVGIWEGTYDSTTFGGSHFDLTITAEADGFYTDSSGHLMPPSYYPDTQQWEFQADTNRMHFWYLDTVYAGQYFYQHFFYEVVQYTGNTLEMHYNFWDDPEPHPQAGLIRLTRAGTAGAGDDLPRPAKLENNYPNPFNPSTSLSFSLPADEVVSLKVYDTRGREVDAVFEGPLPAGRHNFQWSPQGLPAGVYLYRLQAGAWSETRKMNLVK